ncbi:ligase-associated DNA damage response DEXH box helicase [Rhodocytophaga rosea]|uniref:Ligase-associated DNA damage response DEXH box helicase n=1 Tax=Rhodocytophaga rosea TaxID=2704465 RepID=A0A6C0GP85_9BACT|nr:ligase-associated DNA damage response DEXH box helicase [Rhodocytophaga rosea]QHT69433.1 ligase-associated DNA damage response DEXH box helicase [Rhodocytophaga rosea]
MEHPFYPLIEKWFAVHNRKPFHFQLETWQVYLSGKSGLLNAPTGSGKTLALWIPCLLEYMATHPDYWMPRKNGLQIIWITPLRALAKDLQKNMQAVCDELNIAWQVGLRTADTTSNERQKQKRNMPECLITTPESLHLMLSQKEHAKVFEGLQAIIIDEWHELLGNKRGIQVELALSRLKTIAQLNNKDHTLKIWGVSATIGNLEQAMEVLLGKQTTQGIIIRADIHKSLRIESILPDDVKEFPWVGHLGLKLIPKLIPIIEQSQTTLLFTNTRAQTEIWYQHLLLEAPELAGAIAMHHGSLDRAIREWVEDAIAEGRLKVVVCTSSLDLGVDFSPVETIIQVGSPKGIARFLQRAGRSGHQPGALSKIYFVPSYSLELIESAALQDAVANQLTEERTPLLKPMDVLVQYLVTIAVGDGFYEDQLYNQIRNTYAYSGLTEDEWNWALDFITTGGKSLGAYDEFSKVDIREDGLFYVQSKKTAARHRLSIGTIVSDPVLRLKYLKGSDLGTIEESFVSRLEPGDVFWFGGKNLEYVRIREMTVWVRKATTGKGVIPRWGGSRLSLSSDLSQLIRQKLEEARDGKATQVEFRLLKPLLAVQQQRSLIPAKHELLIEKLESREGYHVFMYPFEGRQVHEVLSALIAYRISKIKPISFSIAMNDYGFELLSDVDIPIEEALEQDLFSTANLLEDIEKSINETEMAKRRFRDIAAIAGLVFMGYPGKNITSKHLQASSQLLFDVFQQYEPENLLVKQAFREVLNLQLEQSRLSQTLHRIHSQQIRITYPRKATPFAFPIMIDRLRQRLSSEKLEDRIAKMQVQVQKW